MTLHAVGEWGHLNFQSSKNNQRAFSLTDASKSSCHDKSLAHTPRAGPAGTPGPQPALRWWCPVPRLAGLCPHVSELVDWESGSIKNLSLLRMGYPLLFFLLFFFFKKNR